MAEENVKKEKNPLEKIAEMTTEMAKLVLVTHFTIHNLVKIFISDKLFLTVKSENFCL